MVDQMRNAGELGPGIGNLMLLPVPILCWLG